MTEIHKALLHYLHKGAFIEGVFSNVKKKSLQTYSKVTAKPVLMKGEYLIQLTYQYDKKVLHENLDYREAASVLEKLLDGYFKQGMVFTAEADYQMLANKKGEIKVLKQKPSKKLLNMDHNVQKQYVLEEGKPVDFLVALGIMNDQGKVIKAMYPKFRQINKYLEILEDAIKSVDFDAQTLRVVDFGCGKAYLTFAMHYYFVHVLKKQVEIVGLDLKADVIAHLTDLKDRLAFEGLRFQQGNISDFEWDKSPDIVVSLHACDTATDAAIAKAISWQAKVIMAVPCCQHQAFDQIHQADQSLVLKHGLLKERYAALATDAIRAAVMELAGYSTVVMEFVDMEHTPKNIMLRGRYTGIPTGKKRLDRLKEYQLFIQYWGIEPELAQLLPQLFI